MPPYDSTPRLINLGSIPAIPELSWSIQRRLERSQLLCAEPGKHKGRKRRHRREVSTKRYLAMLAALEEGTRAIHAERDRIAPWKELVESDLAECPAWLASMRAQARSLAALARKHGPASGWGLEQRLPRERWETTWTPYYVPKKAEKCWRWWRALMIALSRLLLRLTRALASMVPLHRTLRDGPSPNGERPVSKQKEQILSSGVEGPKIEPLWEYLARLEGTWGESSLRGGANEAA